MRKIVIYILFFSFIFTIIYSCQDANQIKQDIYYVNGRDIYIKNCLNCHGSKGEGLAALSPPLTDSIFLKTNKHRIACFIKHGVSSRITVAGQEYEENMPAVDHLADIDIAQVIVYISNNFGNKQGMYTSEQVRKDLSECK